MGIGPWSMKSSVERKSRGFLHAGLVVPQKKVHKSVVWMRWLHLDKTVNMKQNIGFNWARELDPQQQELNQHPINKSCQFNRSLKFLHLELIELSMLFCACSNSNII